MEVERIYWSFESKKIMSLFVHLFEDLWKDFHYKSSFEIF